MVAAVVVAVVALVGLVGGCVTIVSASDSRVGMGGGSRLKQKYNKKKAPAHEPKGSREGCLCLMCEVLRCASMPMSSCQAPQVVVVLLVVARSTWWARAATLPRFASCRKWQKSERK